MASRFSLVISAIVVATGFVFVAAAPAAAQVYERPAGYEEPRDESLYYQPVSPRPDVRSIIHEKAQARAYQRQARIASLNWYGMSNARPTASPTPFTSLYSPVWQMPGGRPFAWHSSGWPTYIYYTR